MSHELTTFCRKLRILQPLPETHSSPARVHVAVRLESIFLRAPLLSLQIHLPLFFATPSILPFILLSITEIIAVHLSWQFTLFVIIMPVMPNNQITETP